VQQKQVEQYKMRSHSLASLQKVLTVFSERSKQQQNAAFAASTFWSNFTTLFSHFTGHGQDHSPVQKD